MAAPAETTRRTVATLHLPFVTAQLWVPRVRLPGVRPAPVPRPRMPAGGLPRVTQREVGDATRVVTSHLPPRHQLAYYAGLGTLALFQVVEWPVAVAVGVGSALAGRQARNEVEQIARARTTGRAQDASRDRTPAPPRKRTPTPSRTRTPASPRKRTSASPGRRTPTAPRQRQGAAPAFR